MVDLVRVVYVSKAEFAATKKVVGTIEHEVARILIQSRSNNQKKQIGGVLYYGNGYFFQCLEGERTKVENLIHLLKKDSRHSGLKVIYARKILSRAFKDWSMKYVPIERDVSALLTKHGYQTFEPYKFDKSAVEGFVALFSRLHEPDVNKPADKLKYSFWQRFLALFGISS